MTASRGFDRVQYLGAGIGWRDLSLVMAALILDIVIWGGDGSSRLEVVIPRLVVVLTGVGVFAVLLVRARHPWGAFLSAWVYSVLWGALLPAYQPFTGLLIALYQFARHAETRVALRPLPLLIVPWAINTYNAVVAVGPTPITLSVTAAIWCAFGAIVWVAGRTGYRSQHIYELEMENQAAAAALALQQQRMRLAYELHDIVAHSISGVMFQAAGLRAGGSKLDPSLDEALRAIEASSTQATRELRRLLGLLHPDAAGRSTDAVASLADLETLLNTTRACAVDVRMREEGQRVPLDPSVDHAAYRVLQESLANVMKHGGAGAQADVLLAWHPATLEIVIRSRPGLVGARRVPTHEISGYGLKGLSQRVVAVGGHLRFGAEADGFLVAAELPLVAVNPRPNR